MTLLLVKERNPEEEGRGKEIRIWLVYFLCLSTFANIIIGLLRYYKYCGSV
jgi:hypothetical protein